MILKRLKGFNFFFNKESVVMKYNNQYTCFHTFGARNKNYIKGFGNKILHSRKMDINKVYSLAKQYQVEALLTTGSSLEDKVAKRDYTAYNASKSRILW